MKDKIVLIMGASGSGKSTIANYLEDKYGLRQIKSYTTRPMRDEDYERPTHTFVTDEEFDKLTKLVGYTVFNGYKYCATEKQVAENDIYVIDPDGVRFFKEHYKGDKEVITIYIDVSQKARLERMLARGDTPQKAVERIRHDTNAFLWRTVRHLMDMKIENNKDNCSELVADWIYDMCFYKRSKNEE